MAQLGIQQADLAARCGVDARTLQRWRAGGRAALEDAEKLANALGVGTAEVFDGVPEDADSPFQLLRSVLSVLRVRQGTLARAFHTTFEHFGFVDSFVTFAAHPRRGFVTRLVVTPQYRNAFMVVRLATATRERASILFSAQVASRFRYEFGQVEFKRDRVVLIEHFHTRSACAPVSPAGYVDVWVWVASELRELVVVSDVDVAVSVVPGVDAQVETLFDLGEDETRHAVCFRPSAMHLRAAGLPSVFDRVLGSRDGRVDVPVG